MAARRSFSPLPIGEKSAAKRSGEGVPSALFVSIPTRNRATSSIDFTVADSRIRTNRSSQSAANRSSESARCVPRLLPAIAWISSTITVRVVASVLRPDSEPSST